MIALAGRVKAQHCALHDIAFTFKSTSAQSRNTPIVLKCSIYRSLTIDYFSIRMNASDTSRKSSIHQPRQFAVSSMGES